jgi:hypothetical protein
MDTQADNQGQQQNPLSSGFDFFNKLRNPFGKGGSGSAAQTIKKVSQAAVKGLAKLVSSPTFWAVFTTAFVSIITFFSTLFSGS